jgi:putative NADPH-quinone reductase
MGNRILVIDGHPDKDRARLCHALADAYAGGARETGRDVRLLTVAEAEFPLLRTAQDFTTAPIMQGVLGFGGIGPIRLTLFGAIETDNPAAQKARLARVRTLGRDGG